MYNRWIILSLCCSLLGCGDDDSSKFSPDGDDENNGAANNGANNANNGAGVDNGNDSNNGPFIPEVEEFLVREVATTDKYVFVPNSSETSSTVARINGETLDVLPLTTGLGPTEVQATDVDDVGAVAYVLCEGSDTLAVIRGDAPARNGKGTGRVDLLPLARELNALEMAPDGKHAIAYIDPKRPFEHSGVASLQVMALVRLGAEPGMDEVFELSVTRLIRDIEFTNNGELFLLGAEGIQRIRLADIVADTLIRPLQLTETAGVFAPKDMEMEVSPDGTLLIVRSSQVAGIVVYEIPQDSNEITKGRLIPLTTIPTDVDLLVDGTTRTAIVAVRDAAEVVVFDVDVALATPPEQPVPTIVVSVDSKEAGLVQITPDRRTALLYSSLPLLPTLGILDINSSGLRSYPLRNRIRSMAVSPDSKTSIAVHDPVEIGMGDGPERFFQEHYGLTMTDLASGFRRPISIQGDPTDLVMTTGVTGAKLFVMIDDHRDTNTWGLLKIDLNSFRNDFVRLPKKPKTLGLVAGKIFVSQEDEVGRITFFDVDTGAQKTISGYELNAGIH